MFFHLLICFYTQFSPRYLPISFRAGFSRLLFSTQAHAVGFSAHFLLLTPSFLSAPHQSASGVGFHACFSLPAPTTWVFPLASSSSRPAFSPLPAYQLPGWVFSLAFLYPSPRRGFFRSLTTPHAQFFPRYLPISFRAGFSRLLFSTYTHAVGFSARILLLTPSFLSATYPLASWVGFLACFSLPAPTPWVFPLTYYSSRPAFSPLPAYQLSGHVFTLANTRACKNAMRLGIPNAWRFINSKLILLFRLKGIHCRSTEAGMKVQSSSLLPRLQHRFPRSQPEILQSQAPYP